MKPKSLGIFIVVRTVGVILVGCLFNALICRKFVRYIELPECVPQKNYKADARQGVAVEYHTQALPA